VRRLRSGAETLRQRAVAETTRSIRARSKRFRSVQWDGCGAIGADTKVCLAMGYRTDDMDIALGSALLLLVVLGEGHTASFPAII